MLQPEGKAHRSASGNGNHHKQTCLGNAKEGNQQDPRSKHASHDSVVHANGIHRDKVTFIGLGRVAAG